ncbi:MAG: hypothetical protein P4L63_01955 [Candidatus Pacebacteria bacterium]|nr:hypothetical protein [Candidatus Paceibacterota bacterium]
MPKIRNIIIFVAIAAVLILVYIFFVKPSLNNNQATIVSSSGTTTDTSGSTTGTNTADGTVVAQNFLNLLSSVRTIKLDVGIFSDPAFTSLHDSSVTLTPDATVGRPDPFAEFGVGDTTAPTTPASPATPTVTTTPPPTSH